MFSWNLRNSNTHGRTKRKQKVMKKEPGEITYQYIKTF